MWKRKRLKEKAGEEEEQNVETKEVKGERALAKRKAAK